MSRAPSWSCCRQSTRDDAVVKQECLSFLPSVVLLFVLVGSWLVGRWFVRRFVETFCLPAAHAWDVPRRVQCTWLRCRSRGGNALLVKEIAKGGGRRCRFLGGHSGGLSQNHACCIPETCPLDFCPSAATDCVLCVGDSLRGILWRPRVPTPRPPWRTAREAQTGQWSSHTVLSRECTR